MHDDGLDIDWQLGHPGELFRAHLSHERFDIFEFSLAAYIAVRCSSRFAHLCWHALPVFFSKAWLPFELCVRRDAGIAGLADLQGRTVGVPDVHMTAAVWLRVMLRELNGIQLDDVAWVHGRPPSARQSSILQSPSPPGMHVSELAPQTSLQSALENGGVDAAFGDHAKVAVNESAVVRRLFGTRDVQRVLEKLMRGPGYTPVNHVMVVQREVIEQHPGLPGRLMQLFDASKAAAATAGRSRGEDDEMIDMGADVFGDDPYASGLEPNRRMLTALMDQLEREGQLERREPLESLFLPL